VGLVSFANDFNNCFGKQGDGFFLFFRFATEEGHIWAFQRPIGKSNIDIRVVMASTTCFAVSIWVFLNGVADAVYCALVLQNRFRFPKG